MEMKGKLPRNSLFLTLTPFVDDMDLIRVEKRIQRLHLRYQHIHPVLLPNTHPLTFLVIQCSHDHQLHADIGQTFADRILRGRSTIAKILRKWVICTKEKSQCFKQMMDAQPKERQAETCAFDSVGIDFAGPLHTKEGRIIFKTYNTSAYLLLFLQEEYIME
ncbi:hypothetical protein T07_3307 [Trichinella nelsoni]|uniref:Uncharacterized protein n=1 Tax=Trichinella nelsoni TaxID=6336 RepID=A0A0V0RMG7_9BILA|nr:hypothetical protein T07_3307 [Trichinella nelsoni]